MATTISSGFANSPKKLANIADHGVIYGGRGLVFDGVADYMETGAGTYPLNLAINAPATFSIWLKPDASASGEKQMMANYLSTQFYWNSVVKFNGTSGTLVGPTNSAPVGVWTHAVVVNVGHSGTSNATAYLYINGELADTDTAMNIYRSDWSGSSLQYLNIGRLGSSWTSNYFHGTLSDAKIFDVALTEAQVQELYLKPEQSAPSAVRDNLVAWYPMCEGNPDSPQSVVYDHSEKGLGSELLTGTDSDFSGAGNWSLSSGVSIGSGVCTFTSVAGDAGIQHDSVIVSGKVYKLTFDVPTYSAGTFHVVGGVGNDVNISPDNSSAGSKTYIFTSTGTSLRIRAESAPLTCTFDNISLKEVKMGNHATTVFYGDMADIINESNDSEIYDATTVQWTFPTYTGSTDTTSVVDDTDWAKTTNIDVASIADTVGSELIGDATFDDASYWSLSGGSGTANIDDTAAGKLHCASAQDKRLIKAGLLTSGKLYRLQMTFDSFTDGRVTSQMGTTDAITNASGTGTYTRYFTASGTSFDVNIDQTADFTATDISVKEVIHQSFHIEQNFAGGDEYEYVYHALTLVVGKTYNVKGLMLIESGSNAKVEVGPSAPSSGSDYTYWGVEGINTSGALYSDADRAFDFNFVAEATTGYIAITAITNSQPVYMDYIQVREVGVSTAGYDTAVEEQTIPQVPLLRYNEKMVFDGYDDYVHTGVLSYADSLMSNDHSVSLWVMFNSDINEAHLFSLDGDTTINATVGAGTGTMWVSSSRVHWQVYASTYRTAKQSANLEVGKWYHFVGTTDVSASTTASRYGVTLYENGVDSGTAGTSSNNFSNDNYLQLGHGTGSGNKYANVIIDEVSLFNTLLTATEVHELFNDGVALDATTHSKKGNLMGYWRNDGISSWNDRRGWSYLTFDGTGDYVNCGTDNSYFGNGDLTISCWMRCDATGSQGYLVARDTGGDPNRSFYLLMQGDSQQLQMRVEDGSNNDAYNRTSTAIDDGAWHHCVGVYDSGTSITVYIDGVSTSGASGNSGTFPTGINTQSGVVTAIGRDSDGDGQFTGDISQVAIYNKAFTSAEVTAQYNLGLVGDYSSDSGLVGYWKLDTASTDANAVVDLSANSNHGQNQDNPVLNDGNDGTPSGSPESIVVREALNTDKDGLGFPFKNADKNVLRLDGAGDYISVPDSDGLTVKGSFTLEFWYKQDMPTVNQDIIASDDDSNRNYGVRVLSNGKLFFIVWSGGSATSITTDNAVTDGTWKHITCVLTTGTSMTIWVDAVSTKTSTSSIPTTIDDDPTPFKIGTKTTTSEMFKGLLDEIRFYHKALSSAEITKNYKHGKGKHS